MAQLIKIKLASNAQLLRIATEVRIREMFPSLSEVDLQINVARSLANLCLLLADESPHTRNDYRHEVAAIIDDHPAYEVPAP